VTVTRVLAALHGSREDALAREKAEAEAARYRVAQAQQRLDAARAELASLEERLAQLAGAPQAYAAALADKEQYLTRSGDPRGARLLELADQRGRMTAGQRRSVDATGPRTAGPARWAIRTVTERLAAIDADRQSLLTQ
jgi:septal ring factor EnvC (AmiA/AmiB activator)